MRPAGRPFWMSPDVYRLSIQPPDYRQRHPPSEGCARIGESIRDLRQKAEIGVTVRQRSHWEPSGSFCYVQTTSTTPDERDETVTLWDGENKVMLATYGIVNGELRGTHSGYWATKAYIEKCIGAKDVAQEPK